MNILIVAKTYAKAAELGECISTGNATRILKAVYSDRPEKLNGWRFDAVMFDDVSEALRWMSPELLAAIRMSQGQS